MFAMATSVALQYGAPPEVQARKLALMNFEPRGPTANPEIPRPSRWATTSVAGWPHSSATATFRPSSGSAQPMPPAPRRRALALPRPEVHRHRRHMSGLHRHAPAHRGVSDVHKLRSTPAAARAPDSRKVRPSATGFRGNRRGVNHSTALVVFVQLESAVALPTSRCFCSMR
jgi:hypothetical protein